LTTATSHHGGSAVGEAGAVVIGAPAGVAGEAEASAGADVRGEGPLAPIYRGQGAPHPHRTAEARVRMGRRGWWLPARGFVIAGLPDGAVEEAQRGRQGAQCGGGVNVGTADSVAVGAITLDALGGGAVQHPGE